LTSQTAVVAEEAAEIDVTDSVKQLRPGMVISTVSTVVLALAGCAAMSPEPDSRHVHEIAIVKDHLEPEDVAIRIGDGVRWVNKRFTDVTVELAKHSTNKTACPKGFRNWVLWISRTAHLKPEGAASLCFPEQGLQKYHVIIDGTVPGSQIITEGTIRIGLSAP
jgi:hypothetical protein